MNETRKGVRRMERGSVSFSALCLRDYYSFYNYYCRDMFAIINIVVICRGEIMIIMYSPKNNANNSREKINKIIIK